MIFIAQWADQYDSVIRKMLHPMFLHVQLLDGLLVHVASDDPVDTLRTVVPRWAGPVLTIVKFMRDKRFSDLHQAARGCLPKINCIPTPAVQARRSAMGQYRQLLVLLTDIDPHSSALRRALALAHVSGASVHVLGLFEPTEEHLLREERLNEVDIKRQFIHYRERLAQLVDRHRASGVALTIDSLHAEDIRSQAIDYLCEMQPDMVIKDSEALPALARLFGTPLDCALMRGFKGMVLFVPTAAVSLPKRIMVAVDTAFSDTLRPRRCSITGWSRPRKRWPCSAMRSCTCCRRTTWRGCLPRT